MGVNVLLIYLISATFTYALDYEKFVFDTYRDSCPYSKTCTQPAKFEFTSDRPQDIPCCFPCSCEVGICLETESCCPDLGNSSILNEKSRYTECLSSIYPVEKQYSVYFESILKRYTTIRTCPSTFPQEDIVSRCTRLSPKTLDELIFVSDDSGNIYRNRDCALCNGVETFTRWNLMIQCFGEFHHFNRNITPNVVDDSGCAIWSQAPSPLLEKRRCYLSDFDTCNITGEWETYDENIDKACKSGQFGPHRVLKYLYKNIFCYICNREQKHAEICDQGMIKTFVRPFTALVDYRTLSKAEDLTAKCNIDTIYDKYADKCRHLLCPVNTIPSYGECLKLYRSTNGFFVNFGLLLTSSTSLPNKPIDIDFVLESAVFALNNKIEKYGRGCHLCTNNVLTEPEMNHFTLSASIALVTTPTCPESNILSLAKFLDQNSIVFNITSTQTHTFDIQLVGHENNNFSVIKFGHPHYLWSSRDACVLTEVYLTDLQCPRVTITGTDYTMALRNNFVKPNDYYNKNLIDKDAKSLSNIEFDICVDEYFGSNGGGSVKLTTYFTSHTGSFRNSLMLSMLMNLVTNSVVIKFVLLTLSAPN